MKLSTMLLATSFSLSIGCGPTNDTSMSEGGQDGGGGDVPQELADWALGWWMIRVDNATAQEGRIVVQFEVRDDGTVHQERRTCFAGDLIHDNPFEVLDDGTLRILPTKGEDTVPWMRNVDVYAHVELRPGATCDDIVSVGESKFDGNESPRDYVRGHKCMHYREDLQQCSVDFYCGEEEPPPCE